MTLSTSSTPKQAEPVPPQAEVPKAAPTLAERIQASLAAMLEWILAQGGERVETPSISIGTVHLADEFHAVQSLGRSEYAIHELSRLDRKPEVGQLHQVKYGSDGNGVVTDPRSRANGLRR